MTFDEFLLKTLSIGCSEAEGKLAVDDVRIPEGARAAANALTIEWDDSVDPYDFPGEKKGLSILPDGTVWVVGDMAWYGGRMYVGWCGKLKM